MFALHWSHAGWAYINDINGVTFCFFLVGCCSHTLNCFLCLPCSVIVGGFVNIEHCREVFNFIFLSCNVFCQHTCVLCVYVNLEPPIHWFASIEYLCRFMTFLENYFFHVVDDNKLFSVLLHCALNCLNDNKAKPMSWESWTLFLLCLTIVFQSWWSQQFGAERRGSSSSASLLLGPLKGFKMV